MLLLALHFALASSTCSRESLLLSTENVPPISSTGRSGIGGGGFMTVRIPPKEPGGASEVYTIDFRETAPALANTTMYAGNPSAAKYGGLSVAVPGELRGFAEAHKRWGSLPWNRLVQPSVDLAEEWTVDVELARRIQLQVSACNSALRLSDGPVEVFGLDVGG